MSLGSHADNLAVVPVICPYHTQRKDIFLSGVTGVDLMCP